MGKKVFTNIVWMLTMGISCALGTAVYLFYWWWKLCFIISQNSQVKIFYIKFKPNFTGIVLNTLFNMTYIWQPSPSFKMVWLYPETQVSSTNKTCRHDITETLLLVALNTITLTTPPSAPPTTIIKYFNFFKWPNWVAMHVDNSLRAFVWYLFSIKSKFHLFCVWKKTVVAIYIFY